MNRYDRNVKYSLSLIIMQTIIYYVFHFSAILIFRKILKQKQRIFS